MYVKSASSNTWIVDMRNGSVVLETAAGLFISISRLAISWFYFTLKDTQISITVASLEILLFTLGLT